MLRFSQKKKERGSWNHNIEDVIFQQLLSFGFLKNTFRKLTNEKPLQLQGRTHWLPQYIFSLGPPNVLQCVVTTGVVGLGPHAGVTVQITDEMS